MLKKRLGLCIVVTTSIKVLSALLILLVKSYYLLAKLNIYWGYLC